MSNLNPPKSGKQAALAFFFAGLLPVIAFTIIEEKYGVVAGLIAGMVFGGGEIIYELVRYRKVAMMTWFGNGLLLALGAVSLIFNEGLWFKLQPALVEGAFALALWGSCLKKKPLLVWLGEKQGQQFPPLVRERLAGVTFRVGLFFAIHTGLAVWAALYWDTTEWALLKGVGLTVSFVVYLVAEMLWLRRSLTKQSVREEQKVEDHKEI